MKPKKFFDTHNGACDAGKNFALKHKTMEEVWDACPQACWLLWIQQRTRTLNKSSVLVYESLTDKNYKTLYAGVNIYPVSLAVRATQDSKDPAIFMEALRLASKYQADCVRLQVPNPFKEIK